MEYCKRMGRYTLNGDEQARLGVSGPTISLLGLHYAERAVAARLADLGIQLGESVERQATSPTARTLVPDLAQKVGELEQLHASMDQALKEGVESRIETLEEQFGKS